ncbi:MAG: hypothetical protein ACKVKA_11670 [Rhodobacterales bacterium]|jgi:hypothetical protein
MDEREKRRNPYGSFDASQMWVVMTGDTDLVVLNRQSLKWRGKR